MNFCNHSNTPLTRRVGNKRRREREKKKRIGIGIGIEIEIEIEIEKRITNREIINFTAKEFSTCR